jgi:hypothetical protein
VQKVRLLRGEACGLDWADKLCMWNFDGETSRKMAAWKTVMIMMMLEQS